MRSRTYGLRAIRRAIDGGKRNTNEIANHSIAEITSSLPSFTSPYCDLRSISKENRKNNTIPGMARSPRPNILAPTRSNTRGHHDTFTIEEDKDQRKWQTVRWGWSTSTNAILCDCRTYWNWLKENQYTGCRRRDQGGCYRNHDTVSKDIRSEEDHYNIIDEEDCKHHCSHLQTIKKEQIWHAFKEGIRNSIRISNKRIIPMISTTT